MLRRQILFARTSSEMMGKSAGTFQSSIDAVRQCDSSDIVYVLTYGPRSTKANSKWPSKREATYRMSKQDRRLRTDQSQHKGQNALQARVQKLNAGVSLCIHTSERCVFESALRIRSCRNARANKEACFTATTAAVARYGVRQRVHRPFLSGIGSSGSSDCSFKIELVEKSRSSLSWLTLHSHAYEQLKRRLFPDRVLRTGDIRPS